MKAKEKRPYQKPTVEQITLLGEETTVAGCKQATGGGKGATIGTSCRVAACKFTLGS